MRKTFIRKRCLNDEEKIKAETYEHWIHLIYGLNWFVIMTVTGYAISWAIRAYAGSYEGAPFINVWIIPLGPEWWWGLYVFTALGFILFMIEFLNYISTEIAVTEYRLIVKTGLILVDVNELDLGEIRNEDIDYKLFGQYLNYGDISFDARFVGDVVIKAVEHPHKFLHVVHKCRTALRDVLADH